MAKVAANQKLWNSLMRQAKAKYPTKRPGAGTNRAANKWASQEYARQGGDWVSSIKEVDPKLRDPKKELEDKKKAKITRIKKEKKERGIV
jgi:hypothetical protein